MGGRRGVFFLLTDDENKGRFRSTPIIIGKENMAKYAKDMSSDTVTGTGSAISIFCGFRPVRVTIYNRTKNAQGFWTEAMPVASAQLIIDSGAGTTDVSFVTSAGITPVFNGFTIGTNASLNSASDVIYWIAEK